ncbi:MAG: hypothetical protein WC836_08500 [Desulfobacula sp.]|jgi:hypothetical protein
MEKEKSIQKITLIILIVYACIAIPCSSQSKTSGVKTSYKRYSILKYQNEDVLCEPYTVTKDDWLYKILRKKGEISEKDFPHFISIFKAINPQISNIDAIEPGINILIPLKKVNKEDYDLNTSENVNVPVIEFSSVSEDPDLQPFLKKHRIQNGEKVEKLIDKEFLQSQGNLSEEGIKIFQLANPNIKNINILYEGTEIYLPDPAVKSQPWFKSLIYGDPDLTENREKQIETMDNEIEAHKLAKLKKYSSLIGGVLLNQGRIYFPGENNSTHFIDLSTTPVIETTGGEKIIITSSDTMNNELLDSIQSYWKNLKTQLIVDALEKVKDDNVPTRENNTLRNKKMIKSLLSQAGFDYTPDAKIPFTLHHVSLEATFGRVIRKDSTDLLINFGNVYGSALEVLEKREFEIISITPELKLLEVISLIFSRLGYSTWQNPSFSTEEVTVEKMGGLYAVKGHEKLFIPVESLSSSAVAHLKKENIKILSIE